MGESWRLLTPKGDRLLIIGLSVMVPGVFISFLFGSKPADLPAWRTVTTTVILALFLLFSLYFENIQSRFSSEVVGAWVTVIILGVLSNLAGWSGRSIGDELLMYLSLIFATVYLKPKSAVAYAVFLYGAWLFMICVVWSLSFEAAMRNVFGFLSGMVFCFGFGRVIVSLDRHKQDLERQKKRADQLLFEAKEKRTALKETQEKEHRLTVVRRHVKSAAQIHDDLNLAMQELKIQILKIKDIFASNQADALEPIQDCRGQTKSVLDQVRASVAELRQYPVDFEEPKQEKTL
ncbi:MAG: hypothetical protein GY854_03480 [Deltaproteobacteria bacterium]|nr:hypothetical protein [Deltaproteobacteria bacterium]